MTKRLTKAFAVSTSLLIAGGMAQSTGLRDICDRYADCRRLTVGEVAMALPIFGDTIDYDKIRVINPRFDPVASFLLKGPGGMMVPRPGHIMAYGTFRRADYSKDAAKATHFIHELEHERQWRTEPGIMGKFALLTARRVAAPDWNPYAYTLAANRPYAAYNTEQRARMVELFFQLDRGLASETMRQPWGLEERPVAHWCAVWRDHQRVIGQTLPLLATAPIPALCG